MTRASVRRPVMTRVILPLLLILTAARAAWLTPAARAAFDEVDPSLVRRAEYGDIEGFPVGAWPAIATASNPDSIDIRHLDFALRVNMVTEVITGTATLTIRSVYGGLGHAVIDLFDPFTVTAVRVNGVAAPFTRAGATVDAVLDATYPAGGEFTLAIDYSGHPQTIGNKGFKFDQHGTVRMAYTLSTPYSTSLSTIQPVSSRWRPCKDRPDDKHTATFRFTVPDTFLASSNGSLTGVTLNGDGTATFSWSTGHPIAPYLVTFSTTNYDTIRSTYLSAGGGSMPVLHHVWPEHVATARTAFERVPAMITAFAARFGEYPFMDEKYGMTIIRGSTAVENQTNTSMPATLLRADHAYDWLYAHELAHQWWGDCVTAGDWSHVWLHESFATYAEALYMESRGGADSLRAWMETKDDDPFPGTLVNPAYVWVNTVYDKGAWVLHMLRHVIGDPDFFGALADFRAAHEYGNAVTADFLAVVEARHGSDLDWFWTPWLYGTGTPRYAMAWTATPSGDSTRVDLEIRQTQPAGEPTYTMPLDLVIDTAAGPANVVAWNDARLTRHAFMVGAPVTGVTLDPGHFVLHTLDPFPTSVEPWAGGANGGAGHGAATGELALAAFPNPARDAADLTLSLPRPGSLRIDVHDARGRRVRAWSFDDAPAGLRSLRWDCRDEAGHPLPGGIYFVRATSKGETATRKLLLRP